MSDKIPVHLTVAQWNALHTTAVGELESLSENDWQGGVYADLADASATMEKARERWAKRRRLGERDDSAGRRAGTAAATPSAVRKDAGASRSPSTSTETEREP